MADMYIAIGIRWSVMQHEFGAALANLADFLIEVLLLPGLEHDRFTPGKIAAHGKRRVGQV